MDRRELLSALGASAGFAALGTTAWAQQAGERTGKAKAGAHGGHDHAGHGHDEHSGGEHEEHLKTIAECAKVCNETAYQIMGQLRKDGKDREVHAKIHEATMDCQAFCVLSSILMARKSRMAGYAHAACADACRDCAAACEQGDSQITKRCAEICRECEKACRQMAKGGKKPAAGKAGAEGGRRSE